MSKVKYSIIVPVYNVSSYLERCINSVLIQDFEDYEIIIVDDGSTDESPTICDNLSKFDSRIKVIHKKNGGLSSARNEGFNIANGEYTIFLDSDDFWIDKNFLKNLNGISSDKDVIIFNSYKFYNEQTKIRPRFSISNEFYTMSDKQKIKYLIENNIYKACAWDKVIKTELLKKNNIKFPINRLSEDMKWCGEILENVKRIDVYSNVVYAYRQRNKSISKMVNKKHLEDIYIQINDGTKTKNECVLNYFAYEYVILYSYAFTIKDKDIIAKTKKLSWLLKYDLSKKVKKIKYIYKIFGYTMCGLILKEYLKRK